MTHEITLITGEKILATEEQAQAIIDYREVVFSAGGLTIFPEGNIVSVRRLSREEKKAVEPLEDKKGVGLRGV